MNSMPYRKLGNSGATVSAIGLGCMSYGDPNRGNHSWTLRSEDAKPLIRKALDMGVNFFDTANVYSSGESEEILGSVISEYARREEVVIATKVHGEISPGPNGWGLSRKHIRWQVDESLRRLGTDYIDLYQIHRWDGSTPLEETLQTLDQLVRDGKVRYLGASTMYAWQFARALGLQQEHGWTPFVTMQDHYNLIYREEEREMHPLCADRRIGVLAYCPLARGRLTRGPGGTSRRQERDLPGQADYGRNTALDRGIYEAVGQVAADRGISRARVALAWVFAHPVVASALVGATATNHLDDLLPALELQLTENEIQLLEENYVPHEPAGF